MYRDYENPRALEKRIKQVKEELYILENDYKNGSYVDDEQCEAIAEEIIDLKQELDELRGRVNFAWQDEEEE